MIIHICGPKLYQFNGVKFEMTYHGPWPLKKDGDPKKVASQAFYQSIEAWSKMTPGQQEIYRVGGGCQCLDTEVAK